MAHWTSRDMHSYIFAVVSNFVIAVEIYMEEHGKNYKDLAKLLNAGIDEVMVKVNNPSTFSLADLYRWTKALGIKFIIFMYDDQDPSNIQGPLNTEILRQCWELLGKPRTQADIDEAKKRVQA